MKRQVVVFGLLGGLLIALLKLIESRFLVISHSGEAYATRVDALRITPRELEILELIADGLSNRDIAERLFVGEHPVKTHTSRLFDKLDARRRTQAVQIGQQLRLIP